MSDNDIRISTNLPEYPYIKFKGNPVHTIIIKVRKDPK